MVDVLVNGEPIDVVPADDRGLLYGDHLFETVAFVGKRAPLWKLHMARLARDARRLSIPAPAPELLASECARLVAGEPRSVVRITLTRGSGGRAYEPPDEPDPRRILMRRSWPSGLDSAREAGIVLHTSPVRLAIGGPLAGIKHGNRLEQVLAAARVRRAGVDEAVLLDCEGRVVEAIAGNLIVVIEGKAITPQPAGAGVAGVGLQWLRERLGRELSVGDVMEKDLQRAEGVVVINSVAGIRPARVLDDRPLAIPGQARAWQRIWDEVFECKD